MKSDISIFTADGVRIAVSHYRNKNRSVIIVSHGFYNSRNSRLSQRVAGFLEPYYDIVSFDYRGHGQSGGTYTFGAREERDFAAVLSYARCFGYAKTAVMGFSLGAAVPAVFLGRQCCIDSLMLVSCPWSFSRIDCHFWERPVRVALRDVFNANGKGRGVRIGNPFLAKPFPAAAVARIMPPVFFVHGQEDWLIKPWHARALFDLKRSSGKLEILNGGFHGEKLVEQFPEKFARMSLGWFCDTLAG